MVVTAPVLGGWRKEVEVILLPAFEDGFGHVLGRPKWKGKVKGDRGSHCKSPFPLGTDNALKHEGDEILRERGHALGFAGGPWPAWGAR